MTAWEELLAGASLLDLADGLAESSWLSLLGMTAWEELLGMTAWEELLAGASLLDLADGLAESLRLSLLGMTDEDDDVNDELVMAGFVPPSMLLNRFSIAVELDDDSTVLTGANALDESSEHAKKTALAAVTMIKDAANFLNIL